MREACESVMQDPSIDKPSRRRRAEGIKLIGKIWRKIQPENGKEGAWQFLAEMEDQFAENARQNDGFYFFPLFFFSSNFPLFTLFYLSQRINGSQLGFLLRLKRGI